MNEQTKATIVSFLRKPWVIPTAVGVASGVAGFAGGYILGKRNGDVFDVVINNTEEQLEFDFDEVLMALSDRDEIAYANSVNRRRFSDVAGDIENRVNLDVISDSIPSNPMTDGLSYVTPRELGEVEELEEEVPSEPELVTENVFAKSDDWDYETELNQRSDEHPYIIHRDEFFNEEMGYGQSTLTYYAGDNILVDENEVPIYNHSVVTGELKFGHGSEDKNVVYIRNDKYHAEYEILRDSGSYEVEVLGHVVEHQMAASDLKHSNSVPRFRPE